MSTIPINGTFSRNTPAQLANSIDIEGSPIQAANLAALQNYADLAVLTVGQWGYAIDTGKMYVLTTKNVAPPHVWTELNTSSLLATNNTWTGTNAFTNTTTALTPAFNDVSTNVATTANLPYATGRFLYVDGNRTDTYTADGTVRYPYKTFGALITFLNTQATTTSWTIYIATAGYSETNLAFPGVGLIIYGNGSSLTVSGALTFASDGMIFYDLSLSVGTCTFNMTVSHGGRIAFTGGRWNGTYTISGNTTYFYMNRMTIQGTVNANEIYSVYYLFQCSFNPGRIVGSGAITMLSCYLTNNFNGYIIDSSNSLQIGQSNVSNSSTLAASGCIRCDNGAGSGNPNVINNVTLTTPYTAINYGTAYTTMGKNNIITGIMFGTASYLLAYNNDIIGNATIMQVGSDANYDMYYRGSNGLLTRLPANTNNQLEVLCSTAAGGNPTAPVWTNITDTYPIVYINSGATTTGIAWQKIGYCQSTTGTIISNKITVEVDAMEVSTAKISKVRIDVTMTSANDFKATYNVISGKATSIRPSFLACYDSSTGHTYLWAKLYSSTEWIINYYNYNTRFWTITPGADGTGAAPTSSAGMALVYDVEISEAGYYATHVASAHADFWTVDKNVNIDLSVNGNSCILNVGSLLAASNNTTQDAITIAAAVPDKYCPSQDHYYYGVQGVLDGANILTCCAVVRSTGVIVVAGGKFEDFYAPTSGNLGFYNWSTSWIMDPT